MKCNALHSGRIFAGVTVRAAIVAACVLSTLAAASAQAQTGTNFTVKISEKELKLANPTDMMWDKHLMWDLGFQRMNDRNMPYIELMNAVGNVGPITEFHMTIGDTRFNFTNDQLSTFALVGSTTPGFQLTSSTVNGNELVVNIGNGGLQPGQLVRFKIDIDADAPNTSGLFEQPDFRTVLFDMNGVQVYDSGMPVQFSTADNGRAWVVFDPATGPNLTTTAVPFEDELVIGQAAFFFNDNPREWGQNDPVRIFDITGGTVIPEPGSIVLLAGVACGLAFSRRGPRGPADALRAR